jgi:short-subunit dehydrogenase
MKNIVITGSTRGIGLAMAKAFLNAGCHVTLSGRHEAHPQLMEELKTYTGQFHYISCNVQDPVQIERLWDKAIQQWGTVDCWINNAGQNTPHKLIHETSYSDTQAVIATNLLGMIYGSQIAARNMLKQGHGQIWNMEGLGSNNMIQVKTVLYGTTKHALTYFTKGLAKELQGTPVLVGRLSPGMMLTDFITKTPDGQTSDVLQNKSFKFIFNNLGDHPETVAAFFIPRILNNTKNDAHLVWLSNMKAGWRLLSSPLKKRKLI